MRAAAGLTPASVLAALTGCAALTVDVDVYKGPLANEVHVQTQQVAVMAIGAKPLLLQLKQKLQDCPREGSSLIDRVDDVLQLYEDRRLSPFESKLEAVDDASHKALDWMQRFLGDGTESCESEWAKLQELRRPASDAGADRVSAVELLAAGYEHLLTSRRATRKDGTGGVERIPIFDASLVLLGNTHLSEDVAAALDQSGPRIDADRLAANAIWAQLERRDFVGAHAEILFRDEGEVRRRFTERVNGIARAFGEFRRGVRATLRAIAECLVWAARPDSMLTAEERLRLERSFVDVLPDLISPSTLLDVVGRVGDSTTARVPADAQKLRAGMGVTSPEGMSFDKAKEALRKHLQGHPQEAATGILATDAFLPTLDCQRLMDETTSDKASAKHQKRRSVAWRDTGLAAGPTEFADAALTRQKVTGAAILARTTLGAFGRGRTREGLETLIERYVQAAHEKCTERDPAPCERERLMRALAQFSEKLRFLANNLQFVLEPGDEHVIRFQTVLESVANTIQVHVNELDRTAAHDRELRGDLERERAGLDAAADSDPHTAVSRLVAELRREAAEARAALEGGTRDLEAAEKEKAGADRRVQEAEAARDAGRVVADATNATWRAEQDAVRDLAVLGAWLDALPPEEVKGLQDVSASKTVNSIAERLRMLASPSASLGKAATRFGAEIVGRYLVADGETAAATWGRVVAKLRTLHVSELKDAEAAAKAATDELTRREGVVREERSKEEKAKGALAAQKLQVKEPTEKAESRSNVAARAVAVRGQVVDKLAATGPRASQRLVLETFVVVLGTDSKTDDGKAGAALSAREVVELPSPPKLHSNASSRDVLDQLIAVLRHSEIDALAEHGPDSERVQNIRAALAAAYEQRSGMAYLRPAASYLRTSYAVSRLSSNAGVVWRNMLQNSSGSFLPFVDEELRNGTFWESVIPGGPNRNTNALEQREAIDSQFWQSVNRVRVTGGGWTNYAVVKDDIGNWYVKGFQNDPKAIVQSAKNLALFNAGPNRAALLARAGSAKAKGAIGTDVTVEEGTVLGGQLKRARHSYEAKTREARKDVVENLAQRIAADVTGAWETDPALVPFFVPLRSAAEGAEKAQLADAKAPVSSDESLEKAATGIVDGISAVRRFRHDAASRIDAAIVAPTRTRVVTAKQGTAAAESALASSSAVALKARRDLPPSEPAEDSSDDAKAEYARKAKTVADAEAIVADHEQALKLKREEEKARTAERDAAQSAADTAIRQLTDLVRSRLTDRIGKRDRTIAEYESAIGVVSGAAGD